MSDGIAIAFWIVVLIGVYVLTRKINLWRTQRAAGRLIKELEREQAFDPGSAVALPDVQRNYFRAGVRSFRPEGLKMLLAVEMIAMTAEGRFYLKQRPERQLSGAETTGS
ncbi:hypothetical protein [Desulfatitalea alkaliphila]|uniref:Uncharacterized protein n=1 Tax=Desulfatitalea alkaliphila TaxID=2929485 RepID=A0AA41R574_9BACT|nr:hypothetical protein [Desulfatitalea alkaliphila]MCJ8501235.1 hypothetical protein [Desulfatitalea alkaliphila]